MRYVLALPHIWNLSPYLLLSKGRGARRMDQRGHITFLPAAARLSLPLADCLGTASADRAPGRRSEDHAPLHLILICHAPLGHVMITIYS